MTPGRSGNVLGGRYRLDREIARGGMAAVWSALDLRLDRPVALKLLHSQFADEPEFLERFRREARAAASLNHPNVVSVYDVGEDDESGTPFIVMELVEGENLKERIRRLAPLANDEIRQTGAALAATLDYAHRRGLIHRDVKPQNVLLGEDGRPRLTDFGIAQALASSQLTRTGAVMGSVHYLAPELVRGKPASPRSDVYGLGVVLYEMAAGRVPFSGDTDLAIALAHVEETPPAPRTFNAHLDANLERIILHCLAKQPEARYQSAAVVAVDLRIARTAASVTRTSSSSRDANGAVPPVAPSAQAQVSGAPVAPAQAPPTRATPAQPRSGQAAQTADSSEAARADQAGQAAQTSQGTQASAQAAKSAQPAQSVGTGHVAQAGLAAHAAQTGQAGQAAQTTQAGQAAKSAQSAQSVDAGRVAQAGLAAQAAPTGQAGQASNTTQATQAATGGQSANSARASQAAQAAYAGTQPRSANAQDTGRSRTTRIASRQPMAQPADAPRPSSSTPQARRQVARPARRGAGGGAIILLLALAAVLLALGAVFFGLASLSREGIATPAPTTRPTAQPTSQAALPTSQAALPTSQAALPPKPAVVATPTVAQVAATAEPPAANEPTSIPTAAPTARPTTQPTTPPTAPPKPVVVVPTPTPTVRNVAVPAVRGKSLEDARAALQAAGLTLIVKGVNENVPRDVVIDTAPAAGTPLPPGSTVTLMVGTGNVTVPDVAGRTLQQATRELQDNGFRVSTRERRDPRLPPGAAIETRPGAGNDIPRGAEVELTINSNR